MSIGTVVDGQRRITLNDLNILSRVKRLGVPSVQEAFDKRPLLKILNAKSQITVKGATGIQKTVIYNNTPQGEHYSKKTTFKYPTTEDTFPAFYNWCFYYEPLAVFKQDLFKMGDEALINFLEMKSKLCYQRALDGIYKELFSSDSEATALANLKPVGIKLMLTKDRVLGYQDSDTGNGVNQLIANVWNPQTMDLKGNDGGNEIAFTLPLLAAFVESCEWGINNRKPDVGLFSKHMLRKFMALLDDKFRYGADDKSLYYGLDAIYVWGVPFVKEKNLISIADEGADYETATRSEIVLLDTSSIELIFHPERNFYQEEWIDGTKYDNQDTFRTKVLVAYMLAYDHPRTNGRMYNIKPSIV